jgi:hypothetical protein
MRPFVLLAAIGAIAALVACDRSESRTSSTDSASAVAPLSPDSSADARAASLSDTLLPLAPAPRAPNVLAIDSSVRPATVAGTDQVATPFCPTGLKDPASGVTLMAVRSKQSSFKPSGSSDSTVWGRADYKPSDPARFGLQPNQVLRVDCGSRRVLGIAPDITTAAGPTRI